VARSFQLAWEKASQIQGWLDEEEAQALWDRCEGQWLEIGCWKGRSTTVLAETRKPGVAIDWFRGSSEHGSVDTEREFLKNMAGYGNVTVIIDRFEDVPVDLLPPFQFFHLDAEHSYEMTKLATEMYAPLVVKGGLLLLHDAWDNPDRVLGSAWRGVTKFALELRRHPDWNLVGGVRRYAIFEKQ